MLRGIMGALQCCYCWGSGALAPDTTPSNFRQYYVNKASPLSLTHDPQDLDIWLTGKITPRNLKRALPGPDSPFRLNMEAIPGVTYLCPLSPSRHRAPQRGTRRRRGIGISQISKRSWRCFLGHFSFLGRKRQNGTRGL